MWLALIVLLGIGYSSATDTRLFNGDDVIAHAYPWLVKIYYDDVNSGDVNEPICDGVLVTSRHVLTVVSNCVGDSDDLHAENFHVRLGRHNLTGDEAKDQHIYVKSKTVHPYYAEQSFFSLDVALLELETPARITKTVKTIEILRDRKVLNKILKNGDALTLAGWGLDRFYDKWRVTDVVQKLDVTLIADRTCSERGSTSRPGELCYEAMEECRGACRNHGSPIFYGSRRQGYSLVGLHLRATNEFDGCATGIKAATKVLDVIKWIDSYILE